jgi:hypothetical protein
VRSGLTGSASLRLSPRPPPMRIAAAYLALLVGSSTSCARAQTNLAATRSSGTLPSAKRADSMVLIHGGTLEIGIHAADIPRFQKIFSIVNERLFQDEIPRHTHRQILLHRQESRHQRPIQGFRRRPSTLAPERFLLKIHPFRQRKLSASLGNA